ncbi:Mrp/NBP35 family ATP-binding protein [Sphingosinicella sp. BN140058]|uniref:Mrp/NBP35 family ATP-binding protein n=1 Tax=Sphingosinicella sp. BN140058 TaxID=1892855 RepID=UPI0010127042|nr:Mrp/NBP35 family ATP-binding protein [Sphingosinicella sp. BN140058]QAY75806.1 chromosome partitioning protein ParA [Sphingosinicella sp. BN140058]
MSQDDAEFRAALAGIADAEGRIQSARLKDGIASLVIDTTGLAAEARAGLEQRIRAGLIGAAGIADVRIAMTEEKVKRIILAVGSGKGGVGKSTVSANLAIALARGGRKVGLVDADVYGPSQPRLLGTSEKPESVDNRIVPVETNGIRMLSLGQLVEGGKALAWRGPMAAGALGQLIEGDWGDTEILVVDLPPGTGDIQLSLVQKWTPTAAVIVSTPQDLALIDATRAIDLFRKTNIPVLGIVENMSGYACPHCGEVSDPFGAGGAEAAAGVMDIPFLGRVPLTLNIRQSSDAGTPPAAGEGADAEIFRTLAARIVEALNRM